MFGIKFDRDTSLVNCLFMINKAIILSIVFAMKTVDKYQINQTTVVLQNGVQVFLAFHTILQKNFILKRLNVQAQSRNQNQNLVLRQASILKNINHESVYKCHKMLKTKTNLYLVYDFVEGNRLKDLLKTEMTIDMRLQIIKKLCSVLYDLSKAAVVHGNLTPDSIVVTDKLQVKIINLGHAVFLKNPAANTQMLVDFSTFTTKYQAPELAKNQICPNSDLYSLGVIIKEVFDKQFKEIGNSNNLNVPNKNENPQVKKLCLLAQKMMIGMPQVRLNIAQVCYELEKAQGSIQNQSFISSRTSQKSTNQLKSIKSGDFTPTRTPQKLQRKYSNIEINTKKSKSQKNCDGMKQDLKQIMQKVKGSSKIISYFNKRRKSAIILCKMSEGCLSSKLAKASTSLELAFMLLKSATIVVTQIAKLLQTGMNSDIRIDKNQQAEFFASNYIKKMKVVIDQQMNQTREKFSALMQRVKVLPSFSISPMKQQLITQSLSNNTLRRCACEFINSLSFKNQNHYVTVSTPLHLAKIYTISLLSLFESYTQAFQHLVGQRFCRFEQQPFIYQLVKMDKLKLLQLIELNMQIDYKGDNQMNLLTVSAKTIRNK